jgi:hypothetical protein
VDEKSNSKAQPEDQRMRDETDRVLATSRRLLQEMERLIETAKQQRQKDLLRKPKDEG